MTETDLVIVGSGAAGLTAAIVARQLGLDVVVLEKAACFGGTTAYSGGGVWIPDNHFMRQLGIEDSREAAQEYLRHNLGELYEPERVDAFLSHGPEMLKFMERHSEARFRGYPMPDYESTDPEWRKSRTLLTVAYDGARLGRRLADLRQQVPQLMLFGSMQLDGADIHPMRKALHSRSAFFHSAKLIARFITQKVRHGRGTRLTAGNALAARLLKSAIDGGVTLRKNAPVQRLLMEGARVSGVAYEEGGHTFQLKARQGVLLASGGFGANEAMRAQHVPNAAHHWTMQPDENTGDGVRMGQEAGGKLGAGNAASCIWCPMSVMHKSDGSTVRFPHIFLDRYMPGSIVVDEQGRRFTNEGGSYQTFVNTMHARGLTRVHMIANHKFVRRYGFGLARPSPFPLGQYLDSGYLQRSNTLEGLADVIGVNGETLAHTVRVFNANALRGEDPDFGRGADELSRFKGDAEHHPNPSLAPVGEGPYYALSLYSGDLGTVTGLSTNGAAQVLDGLGGVVKGLYAAGADMNNITRGRYPGAGCSLGPAMTFAYIAAHAIADRQPRAPA